MSDDEKIQRYDGAPPAEVLTRIGGVDQATATRLRAVLSREVTPEEASPKCAAWVAECHHEPAWHERALEACAELLNGCGVESLSPEGADSYTDSGVGYCPPFSYVNFGDPYLTTLARDHERGMWVVACWGDLLEEYEKEHKLADYEEFEEEPEHCPSCDGTAFDLEHFPGSARGDSWSWVCKACNHHCLAVEGFKPDAEEEEPLL